MALAAVLILNEAPFWRALLVVQGILVIFPFTAPHETIHRTAFESPRLNRWVAAVCAPLVFLPPKWFRCFHFAHHRFTNDPGNDPEPATEKPRTMGEYLLRGLPVWWFQLRALVVNASGRNSDVFVPAEDKAGVAGEARACLAAQCQPAVIKTHRDGFPWFSASLA